MNDLDETGKPVILNPFSWFYEHICKHVSTDLRIGSLLYAVILIFSTGQSVIYWIKRKSTLKSRYVFEVK